MGRKIEDFAKDIIKESIRIKQSILDESLDDIIRTAEIITEALKSKKKSFFSETAGVPQMLSIWPRNL